MNDKELKRMLNAIIEEIGRTENRVMKQVNSQFDLMGKSVDALSTEVRSIKLSNDAVEILLKKSDELERRIAELEKKTA